MGKGSGGRVRGEKAREKNSKFTAVLWRKRRVVRNKSQRWNPAEERKKKNKDHAGVKKKEICKEQALSGQI